MIHSLETNTNEEAVLDTDWHISVPCLCQQQQHSHAAWNALPWAPAQLGVSRLEVVKLHSVLHSAEMLRRRTDPAIYHNIPLSTTTLSSFIIKTNKQWH